MYRKEQEYLENQVYFTKQSFYGNQGQEIVEVYTEEEDAAWRLKHRENLRAYKLKHKEETTVEHMSDQELWERLAELELQEELENELLEVNAESCYNTERNDKSFVVNEAVVVEKSPPKSKSNIGNIIDVLQEEKETKNEECEINKKSEQKVTFKDDRVIEQDSKLDLLQQVIDKQNELQYKLSELKNRDRNVSKTEKDLMMKLDEMEQLDELEDEINRYNKILFVRRNYQMYIDKILIINRVNLS